MARLQLEIEVLPDHRPDHQPGARSERDAPQVIGTVSVAGADDEQAVSFVGWIGLLAILQHALDPAAVPDGLTRT